MTPGEKIILGFILLLWMTDNYQFDLRSAGAYTLASIIMLLGFFEVFRE